MQIFVDGPDRTRAVLANKTTIYISYQTPIAATLPDGNNYRTEAKHSRTTNKHLGEWRMADVPRKPQAFFDALLADI